MLSTATLMEGEVARYRRQRPELASTLDLYAAVFQAQDQIRLNVSSGLGFSNDQARAKLEAGMPVLEGRVLPVDLERFRGALESITAVLATHGVLTTGATPLLKLKAVRSADLPSLIAGVVHNDTCMLKSIASACRMDEAALAVLLRTVLVPIYQAGAAPYQDLFAALWRKGACPFCGSPPRMARIDRDGKRSLYCSMCRSEWPFARLACAFCGGGEGQLHFLTLDWDKGHRADVCETCKRYIKASDERVLGRQVVLDIEDLVTIPLDLAAAKDGYTPT